MNTLNIQLENGFCMVDMTIVSGPEAAAYLGFVWDSRVRSEVSEPSAQVNFVHRGALWRIPPSVAVT